MAQFHIPKDPPNRFFYPSADGSTPATIVETHTFFFKGEKQ